MAGAMAAMVLPSAQTAGVSDLQSPLKDQAKDRGILYGSAVSSSYLYSNEAFQKLVLAQCACVVPEAEMKWKWISEGPDKDDYSDADKMVEFAGQHRLAMRGHTLLWYAGMPDWFADLTDRASAEAAIVRHITAECQRYRGHVFCWDVVAEAFYQGDERPDGLRKAVLLDRLGPEYIDIAHHAARAADPNALLVLNDYGQIYDSPWETAKRNAILKLLERMKKAGTPIDAVGIEAHLDVQSVPFSSATLRQFLAEIAAMGLKIHITELDANDGRLPSSIALRDQLVADAYERFLDVALDESATNVVVTWGLADPMSWLNGNVETRKTRISDGLPYRPLPYDETLAPKPAWNALARAFHRARWRAPVKLPS